MMMVIIFLVKLFDYDRHQNVLRLGAESAEGVRAGVAVQFQGLRQNAIIRLENIYTANQGAAQSRIRAMRSLIAVP